MSSPTSHRCSQSYPVVTGHKNQREWRVGRLEADNEERILVGKLGWRPLGVAVVPEWSDIDQDWLSSEVESQGGRVTAFGFHGGSRLLAVLDDRLTAAATFGSVFEKILNGNEAKLPEATTEWAVEPILDVLEFLEWLKKVDVVAFVSFTARLPNPEPMDATRDLVARMQARRATRFTEKMVSLRSEGLVGIEHDPDFSQAIAMGEQGFAELRGFGTQEGRGARYSQKQTVATETFEELPRNWEGMHDLLRSFLRSQADRFKPDDAV